MKYFFSLLIVVSFLFYACNSNEKLAKEKCNSLVEEITKADKENWTEQDFYTEINGLKVDRDRLISITESKESIDKETIQDLQVFMDGFTTISQQKKAFVSNIKARKKLLKRVAKLKHDMDKDLGKKETYFDKVKKEEINWKAISKEYKAFENTVKDLHKQFGSIRLNLIRQ
jgi:hypothetical protein